jgi:DNA-binding CsgD family transcriptional regulator
MKLIPIDQLPDASRLTPREREVYEFTGYGMDRFRVAAELGIAVQTVSNHREAIKVKLELADASDLLRVAVSTVIHAELARALPQNAARE